MIYEPKNIMLIPKICKLAKEFLPQRPIEPLKKMLLEDFNNPNAKVIIFEDENRLEGFIYATFCDFEGKDEVFIQHCVIRPSGKRTMVNYEFLSRIRKWADSKGREYIYMMTDRNPKPFIKKFHFEPISTVMRRKVKNEPFFQRQEVGVNVCSA